MGLLLIETNKEGWGKLLAGIYLGTARVRSLGR